MAYRANWNKFTLNSGSITPQFDVTSSLFCLNYKVQSEIALKKIT